MAARRLVVRQGFDQTTAAETARSVGLTERTFFRRRQASTAVTVFTVAFGQWISEGETRPLVEIEREVMRHRAAIASDGPVSH